MTYKGIVRGKVIELKGSAVLPEGTEVEIVIAEPSGSPEALHEALAAPPRCTPEDVTALSEAIAQGKRPVRFAGPFESEGQPA